MDDILAYAKSKKVGVIPTINSPGHMDAILTAMEQLGSKTPTLITLALKNPARTVDLDNQKALDFTKGFGRQVCCLFQWQVRYFQYWFG